jgi:hypothetical protein
MLIPVKPVSTLPKTYCHSRDDAAGWLRKVISNDKNNMTQINIGNAFREAFDTFKAFDNLTVESSGVDQNEFPTSVWQILNHLLAWQAYQLNFLQGITPEKHIRELDTWSSERMPPSEADLQGAVMRFKYQLEFIQTEVNRLPATEEALTHKLKIIQDLALHLSFHVGEVVLMRRVKGSYPMSQQMKEFLQT